MNRLQKFNRKNGPLQIVHDFKFVALNVKDDYSNLDSMTYQEKKSAIFARVDKLYDNGYGGVVLNVDYNNYLQNEEAFKLLKEIIDYTYSRDMKIWIYDEQYYPSGSAGGLTLRNHPEYEGICLACVADNYTVDNAAIRVASPLGYSELKFAVAVPVIEGIADFSRKIDISDKKDLAGGLCWDAPNGEWRVYAFFVKVMYELTYLPQSLRASRRYPNIMDRKAIERFVEVTYKHGYEKYLGDTFTNKVEAVFTDEPSMFFYRKYNGKAKRTEFYSVSIYDKPNPDINIYPYISWMPDLEKIFADRFGYDLITFLPDMFDNTKDTERVKRDFYTLVTELTEDAFVSTNKEYLNSKGIKFSGHYYGEEMFDKHPILYGDVLNHLGGMDIPGCDRLNSDQNMLRYSVALKLASSAAHINGKDKVMIEASNMFDSDQNMTIDKICSAISIMFSHGINVITSYYGENIMPKDDMKKFGEYVARLSSIFEGGKYKIDTLLYYPYEEICERVLPECADTESYTDNIDSTGSTNATEFLISNQICFDFINYNKMVQSKFTESGMITEYGECVKNIVIPNLNNISDKTAEFLNIAHSNGINIYFMGESREFSNIRFTPLFLAETKIESTDLKLQEYDQYINIMHKQYDDCDLYYIVNTINTDKTVTFSVIDNGNDYLLYDPLNQCMIKPKIRINENRAYINVNIGAGRSYILLKK